MAMFSIPILLYTNLLNIISFINVNVIVLGLDVCEEEQKVAEFLEKSSPIFGDVLFNSDRVAWTYAINAQCPDKLKEATAAADEYNVVFDEQCAELSPLLVNYPNYNDESLAYKVKMFLMAPTSLCIETRDEFEKIRAYLFAIYQTASLCPYGETEPINCISSIYDVEAQYQNITEDHDQLTYLWSIPKDVLGSYEGKGMYTDWVKLWQLAAEKQGYDNAVALNMENIYLDPNTAFDDMQSLWTEIKEYYEELMYYVNHKLSKIHQTNYTINVDGLAPIEYFGEWPTDFSFKDSELNPFYDCQNRVILEDLFQQNELTPPKFAQFAEDLFVSMGLPKLKETFWENSFFEEGEDTVCIDNLYHVDNEESYVGMCADFTIDRLSDIYKYVCLAYYYMVEDIAGIHCMMRTVDYYGWQNYIAESVSPSLLSSTYLTQQEIVSQDCINEDTTMYYLFQEYLKVLPSMAHAIAFQTWTWNTFSGEISEENYNCALYTLLAKYQGVKPPSPRPMELFDAVTSSQLLQYRSFTGWFFGYLVKYQLFFEMCNTADYEGDLHQCNLYGNTQAGQILESIMQVGTTQPFTQVFQDILQKPIFDVSGIKEYFKPVYKLIKTYNDENDTRMPWCEKGAENILCQTLLMTRCTLCQKIV